VKGTLAAIIGIALSAAGPGWGTIIVSGSVGNGDFEATEPAASGPESFADTPFWYNASGPETAGCTVDTGTSGSPQPDSRAAVPSTDQAVNAAGHVVAAAGETLSIALSVHKWGSGSKYQGDETVRISLFVASAVVDDGLTTNDLAEVAHLSFNIDGTWVDHPSTPIYTTTASDVGKTLHLGYRLEDPTPPNPTPRMDVLELTVDAGISNDPPAFATDPITKPDAHEGVAYAGQSLAGDASDPESDPISFAKVFGPDWLQVAPDGALSGTPGAGDAGTNNFVVLASALGGSDVATLTLHVEPVPVVLDGWGEFVEVFGLGGRKFIDTDGDGMLDIYEFAHGGDPTNPVSRGILPYVEYATNGTVSFHSTECTHDNPGIAYTAEWTDNLATGGWSTAWSTSDSMPAAIPGYVDVVRTLQGDNGDQLYFRNRLFTFRPNILVIMADDLGYADVGFNGSTDIITPELDRLASNGTVFTSAYVVHPFCGPSRMGLFSGRYPHEYGGPFNLPNFSTGQYADQGIPVEETLISSVLQKAGYFTGIMGKWHMGQQSIHHPNNRGFDDFYGFLGGGHDYFGPYGYASDYRTYPEHNGVADTSLTMTNYITDVLTEYGVRFLNEAVVREQPFFLFMSYNAPHTPLEAKDEDRAVFPDIINYTRQTYAAMVYALDRGVGRLVDALEAHGELDNTLIIFLSDNGGRTDQGASNWPLRGRKGDVVEGGVRVPFLMHWPNVIPAGTTYDHPISAIDFYPTFARLAHAEIPAGKEIDGVDVWDAILSGTSGRVGHPIFTLRHNPGYGATGEHSVGVRQDQWKAVRWTEFGAPVTWRLFNIEEDIHEDNDLGALYPAILSNLVHEAKLWSDTHVQPLWFDDYDQEQLWNDRNLPLYDQVFSLP